MTPLTDEQAARQLRRAGAVAGRAMAMGRHPFGALLLAPGVLQATNGIALLAQRGFDAGIADKAGRVFDWLSTHMAQPADCAGVLERA